MPPAHLLHLPPELLITILESCDGFSQVIALASACKRTYSLLRSSQLSIVRSVGLKCIPAFDEALIAARATENAKAAIQSRRLPPVNFEIADLSAAVRPAELADVPGVLDLQYLADFVERYYLRSLACDRVHHWDSRIPGERDASEHIPSPEEWAQSCRVHFHRAVYHVLLAGPVLAGSYLEPFACDGVPYPQMRTAPGGSEPEFPPEMPPNLRMFISDRYPMASWSDHWEAYGLQNEDVEYLERFPAFDQAANATIGPRQDELFGRLAAWLIQSMKSSLTADDLRWAETSPRPLRSSTPKPALELDFGGFSGTSTEQGMIVLREVMRMLVVYQILAAAVLNSDGNERHGREGLHSPGRPRRVGESGIVPDGARTVFAIILGAYQLEKLHIRSTEKWSTECIVATPAGYPAEDSPLDEVQLREVDIFDTLEYIHARSGRINYENGVPTAPPDFQLFAFILDRFFGMRSAHGVRWSTEKFDDYSGIVSNTSLFTNRPNEDCYFNVLEDALLYMRPQSSVYFFGVI